MSLWQCFPAPSSSRFPILPALIGRTSTKQSSFYGLLITTIVIYCYNKALYQIDKDILKFADSEYCIAYVRSKCLPEAAEQYRVAIRTGNRGELANAMQELKRVLK